MPMRPLKKLNQKHKLTCQCIAQGKTVEQACEMVSLSKDYWDNVRGDPLIKEELARSKEEVLARLADEYVKNPVRERLKKLAPAAAERIGIEMENEDASPRDRLTASEMILNRTGFSKDPEMVQETNVLNLNMSEELLAEILSRGPPRPQPNEVKG